MHSTRSRAGQALSHFPAILVVISLILLSGCGLAMDSEDRLARGEQALADGDARAAIIDAKDVLIKEPDNIRGRLLLGKASVIAGDGPGAEKDLRRALELGTGPADIASDLGLALLMQGKFQEVLDEIPLEDLPDDDAQSKVLRIHGDANMGLGQAEVARNLYTKALQIRPGDIDAQLGIVSSHMAEGNYAQARGAVGHVLETNADNPRAWLFSGSFNRRMGDLESAEANFRAALDLAETNRDTSARILALAGLAEGLLDQRKTDEARPFVDTLATDAPNAFQTKLLVSRIAFADEDWTTAQQNLQQILQVAPNYSPAQKLLGAVHVQSGNLQQAEMYLRSAVAAAPGDIRARQMLAQVQMDLKKAEEAQAVLGPIVSGPNADALSLRMAARASLGQENPDEAIAYLRRIVEDNPNDVDLQFQLAATMLELGRADEAKTVIDAIDVSGSGEDAYKRDAIAALQALGAGQTEAALAQAKDVTQRYEARAGAFNLLGSVQLAAEDVEGARASFQRALDLDQDNSAARRYLAGIAEATGDFAAATDHYQRFAELNPNDAWATFSLGRVAFKQENYEGAAGYLRQALEGNEANDVIRHSLARTEGQRGNDAAAIALLEADEEKSLDHLPSALLLITLKAKNNHLDEGLAIAQEIKERFPDNPATYAIEGELHIANKDLLSADEAFDSALLLAPVAAYASRSHGVKRMLGASDAHKPLLDYLEARPLDNKVRLELAQSYQLSGDSGKSIATYEQVVTAEPRNSVALNNLAWNYYLAEDPRATDTARRAYDADPANSSIVDTLGWILVQAGSVEEGEALLRQAVELEDDQPEYRYHRAYALVKLGKTDEARATLEKILAAEEPFASRGEAEKLLAEL